MRNQTAGHLDSLQNIAAKVGHQQLDITGEQAHWIKYRSYKKKKKTEKKRKKAKQAE
jgi:hypothetical protein